MSTSPAPVRSARVPRRQAERTASTRARLLGATIAALSEAGYARTTTTEVCRRAGVSQGALFKHFPSKTALVCRAAEHLFAALIADFRSAFAAVAGESDRVGAAVRALWSVFREPRLQAAFELYLAARTDAELAAALRPVYDRHTENLRREAGALFPGPAAANADFAAIVDLVVSAMQGVAMGGEALRDDARDARLLEYVTRLVRGAFAHS